MVKVYKGNIIFCQSVYQNSQSRNQ